jgi:hypothetical protein
MRFYYLVMTRGFISLDRSSSENLEEEMIVDLVVLTGVVVSLATIVRDLKKSLDLNDLSPAGKKASTHLYSSFDLWFNTYRL